MLARLVRNNFTRSVSLLKTNLSRALISNRINKYHCIYFEQNMFRHHNFGQYQLPLEIRDFPNNMNHNRRFHQDVPSNLQPIIVNCNELRENYVGKLVQISGRTMKQKHGRFVQIKDNYGVTQLVVSDDRWDILEVFSNIPHDSHLEVIGWVSARPKSSVNNGSDTGTVEVRVEKIVNFIQNNTGDLTVRNNTNFKNWAKLTSEEYKKAGDSQGIISRFENRKTTCGDLRISNVGQFITLVGWVEDKKFGKFVQIQDGYGSVQVVIPDQNELTREVNEAKIHTIVEVKGHVRARPLNQINRRLDTGDIEVNATHFSIINPDVANEIDKNKSKPNKKSFPKLTVDEETKCNTPNLLARFKAREYTCGGVRLYDVGKTISLIGWVHNIKMDKFIHIKDGYGILQVVANTSDNNKELDIFRTAKVGTLIEVSGKVTARPPGQVFQRWLTGEVELSASSVKEVDPDEHFEVPLANEFDIVSKENDSSSIIVNNNSFSTRTHTCGELNLSNVGESVILAGWLEFQRMNKFITLRDGYGSTQIIIPNELSGVCNLENHPYETILEVQGKVSARPQNMINDKLKTGEIEVILEAIKIINNVTEKLPFEIRNYSKAKEPLRMRYRYMDLRYEVMQENLRLRSKMLMKMREYLINEHNFVEVETPTLFRRTPGGAQEFVVPTRYSGQFYSLVQSPQQFKQMLMAGAIDRYFQIARCYRDEGARPDRQPEFTQLDIEMSFPQPDGLLKLIEGLLNHCWPNNKGAIEIPFPRFTYAEVMEKYGTDQPDTSFGFELQNLTKELSANNKLNEEYDDFGAYAIHIKGLQAILSAQMKNKFAEIAKNYACVKLIQSKLPENDIDTWCKGKLSTLFGTKILENIAFTLKLQPQNVVFIAFGNKNNVQKLLGKLRVLYKEELISRNIEFSKSCSPYNFLWVTDFPLFTPEESSTSSNNTESVLSSTHHPFTAPNSNDVVHLYKEPLKVRSQAYDLVLNGWEIGGGSIRIHDPKMQKYVLSDILKIEHEHLKHLIEALGSGCPPHGGIALGLDRLLAIICKATSIRDVIAFPKGVDGRDPLSGAPVPISEEEKQMYHIETRNHSIDSVKQNANACHDSKKRSKSDEVQEVTKKVKTSVDV